MQAEIELPRPLLDFQAPGRSIDLSAWISGLSFAAGLALAATPAMAHEVLSAGPGLYLLLAAYAVFLASVLLIQRHMRLSLLADTFGSPARLVTSGIFQYSRNPIYVAFFVPLAAIGYFSLSAAIAAIALYVLAMNLTVIRREERELLQAFGKDYARYLTSVPRWVI